MPDIYFEVGHSCKLARALAKRAMFSRLAKGVADINDAVTVLGGDINLCARGEGVLNVDSGSMARSDTALVTHWEECFSAFTEYSDLQFTHATRTKEGRITNLSRLDRVFSNAPPGSG